MKKGIDKGTVFMSILISGVLVAFADLFILSFVINFPTHKNVNDVTNALKEPLALYYASKNADLFKPLQLIALVCLVFLSFKIFKLISGNSYKDASKYGAHGTARFANNYEIFNDKDFVKKTFNKSPLKNLNNTPGLIFGLINNKPLILPENTTIPNRNVFIVGSPGSGKTQSYLLTNLIFERKRSMVITDPKGEIYEATAKLKEQQGYEVRLINFKEMMISDRYNPIDYITKEVEAEQVANTIVINSMQGQKPDFWTKAEIALLKTLLLYVKYETPAEANLPNVKRILTTHGTTPEQMDEFFSYLEPDHPAFSAYQIVRMASDKVRDSIFVSLAITLSKFDAKDVRRFTETSDFLLDDIGRKKMIVYVILPVADSTWEPITANFFTQMFQRLYDVADKNFNKLPIPVNLFLDEFPNLGKIPGYEEILATCRSYGISSSTIVQSMGQLIDKYNKEKAEAIFNNCSLRYLLGVGDKLTAEYFSDLIGKTTIQTQSSSISKNSKGGSDSKSSSYTGRNLMTMDEITRMSRDEAILLVSGGYAIQVKKAFQFIYFKGILNDNNKTSRFDYYNLSNQSNKSELKKEKIVLEKKEHVSSGYVKSTLEDYFKDDALEDYRSLSNKTTNEKNITDKMDNVKESIIESIMNTDSMLQSFDNKIKDLKEKEKNVLFNDHVQKKENGFVSLEIDEHDLQSFEEDEEQSHPFGPELESEDDLILPLGPEDDKLLLISLQSSFADELDFKKEEYIKNEERVHLSLDR